MLCEALYMLYDVIHLSAKGRCAVALADLSPGTLVLSCDPLAAVLEDASGDDGFNQHVREVRLLHPCVCLDEKLMLYLGFLTR